METLSNGKLMIALDFEEGGWNVSKSNEKKKDMGKIPTYWFRNTSTYCV